MKHVAPAKAGAMNTDPARVDQPSSDKTVGLDPGLRRDDARVIPNLAFQRCSAKVSTKER